MNDAEPITHTEDRPPEWIVALLGLIAKWMGADTGRWRLEFEFTDGHLSRWFRHEGPGSHEALTRLVDSRTT
jgi:hypothetical protein